MKSFNLFLMLMIWPAATQAENLGFFGEIHGGEWHLNCNLKQSHRSLMLNLDNSLVLIILQENILNLTGWSLTSNTRAVIRSRVRWWRGTSRLRGLTGGTTSLSLTQGRHVSDV